MEESVNEAFGGAEIGAGNGRLSGRRRGGGGWKGPGGVAVVGLRCLTCLLGLVLVLALALVLAEAGCGRKPVLVFAAASLADALQEAGTVWQHEHPETPVQFNFAGSDSLARQIAAGAPADLFVSANRAQLDRAERTVSGRAVALLGNQLVVVAPRGSGARVGSAQDLLAFERVGLADPEGVPAGQYARAWLEKAGVWKRLAPKVVPALDVRANLAAVASGSVPVGVVYATDAVAGDSARRVRVVYRVPPEEAPEIVYWAAPVEGARSGSRAFLEFLLSPEAAQVFRGYGFRHLPTRGAPGS
jgi:molybdate transport system substrate-binding protein